MVIRKLNELKNIDSFMQVDIYKGYSYLDRQGLLLNHFLDGKSKSAPKLQNDGLLVEELNNGIQSYKITPSRLWAHFTNPPNIGKTRRAFIDTTIDVIKLLNIEQLKRIGWRNKYVFGFDNVEDLQKATANFVPRLKGKLTEITYSKDLDNGIHQTINIEPVQKLQDIPNLPEYGILFDIDTYLKFPEMVSSSMLSSMLDKIQAFLVSPDSIAEFNIFVS